MDAIDKKLLGLLQEDTKKTTKELSMVLNLSVTAVYERIKKLEREGVISKYVAILDRNKVEKAFVVFCHIKLNNGIEFLGLNCPLMPLLKRVLCANALFWK